MDTPPTDWRSVGDLTALLDPAEAADFCRAAGLDVERLTPDYLRLKVTESATVGYRVAGAASAAPPSHSLHVRTFADPTRASAVAAKWADRPTAGTGVHLAPSGHSVIFGFPNDGEIHGLRHVVSTHGWRRLLTDVGWFADPAASLDCGGVDVVRYKPGRRAVGRVALGATDGSGPTVTHFFRYFGSPKALALGRLTQHLHRSGVPVPEVLLTAGTGRLLVEALAPGSSGTDAWSTGALELAHVVDSLRTLHGVRPPSSGYAERADRAAVIGDTLAAIDMLAVLDPTLADPALRLSLAIRHMELPDTPPVVLHGDLHLDQVLHDGTDLTLVDLEWSRVGPAGIDIGSLVAHLVEVRLDPTRSRPRRETGSHLTPGDVAHAVVDEVGASWRAAGGSDDDLDAPFVTNGLVRRALLAVRTFDTRLPHIARDLLEAAVTIAAAPRWVALHPRPQGQWTATVRDPDRSGVLEGSTITPLAPLDDERLRGLASALGRGRLVAHRAGRRAVVATETGTFIKVVPRSKTDLLARRHSAAASLFTGSPDVSVPSVLDVDLRLGLVELQAVAGTALFDTLTSDVATARRAALDRAALVLTALAAADVTAVELPAASDGGPVDAWADIATRWHAPLGSLQRPLQALLRQIFAQHVTLVAAFVHGDLHDKNVLLDGHGGGVIDLDAAGVGDPAIDAGNLAAHVVLRALQRGDSIDVGRHEAGALIDSLQGLGHRGATDSAVGITAHTARTLHRLSVVYRCRARWAPLAPVLVGESWRWASRAADLLGAPAADRA